MITPQSSKLSTSTAGSKHISVDDLAGMLELPVDAVRTATGVEAVFPDLIYRELTLEENAEAVAKVESVLADPNLNKAGAEALARWEQGWGEILARIEAKGVSLETLTPQYFHHDIMRFQGRYIRPETVDFEQRFFHYVRTVIYREYLADAESVVEFGCGTGSNLLLLHQMFPMHKIIGCDWAHPSQKILEMIAAEIGADIHGTRFDMFTLDGRKNIQIDDRTVVMTMHAMEQLGANFEAFLEYLIEARPGLCLHIEPIAEFYDVTDIFDKNAYNYHNNRKYLSGFFDKLNEHQLDGKIAIKKAKRLGFGSQFQEAYSLLVWKVV